MVEQKRGFVLSALLISLALIACNAGEIPSKAEQSGGESNFTLSVEDQSVTLVQGDRVPVTIGVTRKDGFDGDVALEVVGLPPGVSVTSQAVSGDEVHVVFSAASTSEVTSGPVEIRGTSGAHTVAKEVVLSVVPNRVAAENLNLELIADGLNIPWDLAFSQDGTLYFTERPGQVYKLLPEPNAEPILIPFSSEPRFYVMGEAGLMGMALDPNFPSTPYVYLCYSFGSESDPKSKIARYTLQNNILSSERTLLTIPDAGMHNGCRLTFGPDGKLYATMGDLGVESNAQDKYIPAGKVLRINPDGSIPEGNPFDNAVWSYGHRNPQGIDFDPVSERLYITEHGPDVDDELNLIKPGSNYGWPVVTGTNDSNGFTPALESYCPAGTIAIAGMSFYQGEMFPSWQNDILFVALKTGRLYHVTLSEGGDAVASSKVVLKNSDLDSNSDCPASALITHEHGRLRAVAVNPTDGSVYLTTSNGDGNDKILRLSRK